MKQLLPNSPPLTPVTLAFRLALLLALAAIGLPANTWTLGPLSTEEEIVDSDDLAMPVDYSVFPWVIELDRTNNLYDIFYYQTAHPRYGAPVIPQPVPAPDPPVWSWALGPDWRWNAQYPYDRLYHLRDYEFGEEPSGAGSGNPVAMANDPATSRPYFFHAQAASSVVYTGAHWYLFFECYINDRAGYVSDTFGSEVVGGDEMLHLGIALARWNAAASRWDVWSYPNTGRSGTLAWRNPSTTKYWEHIIFP